MEIRNSGNNSSNVQIDSLTNNSFLIGIDEKRVREICDEKFESFKRNDFTTEALNIANTRINEFRDRLIRTMRFMHNPWIAFCDPSFQFLLVEAQKAAALTERTTDYDILSELLAFRAHQLDDRNVRIGVKYAVQIIGDISNDALLGLTLLHAIYSFTPSYKDLNNILNELDDYFGKIIYSEFPSGDVLIDNLGILRVFNLSPFYDGETFEGYYMNILDGIVVTGIKNDSEEYRSAKEILERNNIPFDDIFVENSLLEDYVRINFPCKNSVSNSDFDLVQKKAIMSIFELYSYDKRLEKNVKQSFIEELKKRPNVFKLMMWRNSFPPYTFIITSVGKILAEANIKRLLSE